jgi:DNA-binding CsgD family transcriptional regulator
VAAINLARELDADVRARTFVVTRLPILVDGVHQSIGNRRSRNSAIGWPGTTNDIVLPKQLEFSAALEPELYIAVELLVLLARVLAEPHFEDESLALLGAPLRVGAAARLFRTFLDGGPPVVGLPHRLSVYAADSAGGLEGLRPYLHNLLLEARTAAPRKAWRRFRGPGDSLSPREEQVIRLMSHGLSNKRIARELRIGPETVKSHAKRLLRKLGAQNRVEAVSRAFSLGML